MAKSDTAQWEAALEGFTKESFEADGKRRDIYRAGSGPAVIVISEMPGITPLVAEFGQEGGGGRMHGRDAAHLR